MLIVLQGIDAAGNDDTIRHGMDAFNLAVAHVVGETIEALDPQYPPSEPGTQGTVIPK